MNVLLWKLKYFVKKHSLPIIKHFFLSHSYVCSIRIFFIFFTDQTQIYSAQWSLWSGVLTWPSCAWQAGWCWPPADPCGAPAPAAGALSWRARARSPPQRPWSGAPAPPLRAPPASSSSLLHPKSSLLLFCWRVLFSLFVEYDCRRVECYFPCAVKFISFYGRNKMCE